MLPKLIKVDEAPLIAKRTRPNEQHMSCCADTVLHPLQGAAQGWVPAPAVGQLDGLHDGAEFERRMAAAAAAAAAAAEPTSAGSQATSAAIDYGWDASVGATDVQQGLAAMAMHGGSSTNLHHDRQVRLFSLKLLGATLSISQACKLSE